MQPYSLPVHVKSALTMTPTMPMRTISIRASFNHVPLGNWESTIIGTVPRPVVKGIEPWTSPSIPLLPNPCTIREVLGTIP